MSKSYFRADTGFILNKVYILTNIAEALLCKNNTEYADIWARSALSLAERVADSPEGKKPHAAALVAMGSVYEVYTLYNSYRLYR